MLFSRAVMVPGNLTCRHLSSPLLIPTVLGLRWDVGELPVLTEPGVQPDSSAAAG